MSDAAPPDRSADTVVDASRPGALSSETIERILSDFRTWLSELAQLPSPSDEPPAIDLNTLVAQFTALRHEVNLQTRAARSTLEQNGEAIEHLRSTVEQLQEQPEVDDGLDPLLKAIVDVYDNLALALRQVERQRDSIEVPLQQLTDDRFDFNAFKVTVPSRKPSFFSFLVARGPAREMQEMNQAFEPMRKEMELRQQRVADSAKQARSSFDSLIAGYRMSLARIERVLEQYELTTIATVGEEFDPEYMEVVEVVGDSGKAAGTVLEEVRRGYVRDDVVFRYAQVKVAR